MAKLDSGGTPDFREAIDQSGPNAETRTFLEDLLALEGFQECWMGNSWAELEVDDEGALLKLSVDMPKQALKDEPVLPASVGACTRLRCLQLREMGLGGLCDELGCCMELRILSVPGNPLRGDVPESLNGLTLLEKLIISNCHMTGRFLPIELFKRLACTGGTYLYLANNSFAQIDFRDYGLSQFTTGELRPWRSDEEIEVENSVEYLKRGPVCVSSFPGVEFMQWMLMLMRNSHQDDRHVSVEISELCVFLEEYASAQVRDKALDEWHAGGEYGSPTCQLHARYFEAASACSGGATVRAHEKFGCMWFHRWAANQVKAVLGGHRRFLVFTLSGSDHITHVGRIGTCQKAEYAFLKSLQAAYPGVEIGVASIANLEYFMREPLNYWLTNARLNTPPEGCESLHEHVVPFPKEEYEQLFA